MFSCVQLYSCLCLDAWEPRQLPSQSYKLKQLQKEQTFNKIWQERNSFFFLKKKKIIVSNKRSAVIHRKKKPTTTVKNLLPSPSLAVHQISVQFLFATPPAVCGMNSDHLVQMKNLRFPPDLPKFPERKVACGDPAANNLKEGKNIFPFTSSPA